MIKKTKKNHHSKVIIVGSGAAGYTAAIYAARANLSPVIISGSQSGGQLTITTDVENYPGFSKIIQGPWLMEEMKKQAENVGAKIYNDHITRADLSKKPFTCYGDSGTIYTSKTLIIATGANARWLGLSSETKFQGHGVSACATCDGFFFKNKVVAVVGGGNTAAEEAVYLTNHAKKVYLIHRRNSLRSEKILQDRIFKNKKIEILWNNIVEEVIGKEDPPKVTSVKLKNLKTKKTRDLKIDGLFIAIGHDPATKIFKGQVETDSDGYIITSKYGTSTSIPGVFAAGDVMDKIYRQAVTAAGFGCMSALEAEKFLAED